MIKKIVDMAEAARVWFRRAKLGESAARKAETIKLQAQRKGGEILLKMERGHGPGRGHKNITQAEESFSPYQQTVKDAGLSRNEVRRYQDVAVVPATEFNGYLIGKEKAGGEISQAELLRVSRAARKQEQKAAVAEQLRNEPLPPPEGPFRIIVIDPPWRYSARAEDATHRARNPYLDMSLEEIKALPIAALAQQNSIVWLWTTNAFLRSAFDCLDAWVFIQNDADDAQRPNGTRRPAARQDGALSDGGPWETYRDADEPDDGAHGPCRQAFGQARRVLRDGRLALPGQQAGDVRAHRAQRLDPLMGAEAN